MENEDPFLLDRLQAMGVVRRIRQAVAEGENLQVNGLRTVLELPQPQRGRRHRDTGGRLTEGCVLQALDQQALRQFRGGWMVFLTPERVAAFTA